MKQFEGLHQKPRERRKEGKEQRKESDRHKAEEAEKFAFRGFRGKPHTAAHAEDEGADENKAAAAEAHHARGTAERHFERMAGGEDIQDPQPDKGRRRNEAGKRAPQKGEAQREEGDEQELGKREKGVASAQHVVLVEIPAEEPPFAVSALLQYPEHGRQAKAHDEPRRDRPRKDG